MPRAIVERGERVCWRETSFRRFRRVIRVIFREPQVVIRESIWSFLLLGLEYCVRSTTPVGGFMFVMEL